MFKRILLFLLVNLAIIVVLSVVTSIFNIKPYISPYGLNLTSLFIFATVIGFTGSFISLFASKWMAKHMMNIHIINTPRNHDEAKITETISRISQQLNIKMPEVGIYPSPEVNAFATGPSKNKSLVAVSEGLLNEMDDHELEGVLAHEMAHIANGDMVTMTLIQGVVNTFVIFAARAVAFVVGKLLSRDENVGSLAYFGLSILFEIIFGILASTIVFWFSRRREFAADRGGAQFVGKNKMIAALKRLQTLQSRIDTRQKAFATMKISDKPSGIGLFFSSHPPLQVRIETLQKAPIH